MFKMSESTPKLLEDFHLPFGGQLNLGNRWVQLSQMMPWDQAEDKYTDAFQSPVLGQQAYSVRIALGALVIKERLGLSDRETTLQIMENPYLQFFLGYSGYVDQEPFHHSLMTHFRARLVVDILAEVNGWVAKEGLKAEQEEASKAKEEAAKDKDDDDPDGG
jgi:IS5 family transposase